MRTGLIASLIALAAIALLPAEACAAQKQVLYRFGSGDDGAQPMAGLTADSSGNLYGTTSAGGGAACGGYGCGTAFELAPQQGGGWSETILHRFQGGTDGADPDTPLIADTAGNLYGTTSLGGSDNCGAGSGCGTVFELSPNKKGWTEEVLYSFTTKAHESPGGAPPQIVKPDVWAPNGIVFGADGNLYGFASLGGRCKVMGHLIVCYGGAFVLEKPSKPHGAWHEKVIYRVKNVAVAGPEGPPVFDANGNLYGLGASANYGSVFMLKPPEAGGEWTASTLYTFQGGSDGGYPAPGLVFDAGGNLYGATTGYLSLAGNVFELATARKNKWSETPLFTFSNPADGSTPAARPMPGANGTFYGVTVAGGQNSQGVVYALTPKKGGWKERVLASFAGGSDGATPEGTLVSAGGVLYGVTYAGGNGGCFNNAGCGTLFAVTP